MGEGASEVDSLIEVRPRQERVEPARPALSEPPAEPPRAPRSALARRYVPREHRLISGNRCTLLRDGVEAFPAMLEAIRGARRYVRVSMYMFLDDSVGELFSRALCEAAERGVEVQVLYDAIGSFSTPRSFWERMRQSGVDVRPIRPFSLRAFGSMIQRDHRKLIVVDGKVAFTGGINLAAAWAPRGHAHMHKGKRDGKGWRDDVLRIEGPAALMLERRILASWRMHFARRLAKLRELIAVRRARALAPPRGTVALTVLSSRRSIYRAYLHAIANARQSVLIAAAYFVPDKRMVAALQAAARRGVRVEVIVNAKWDHPLFHFVTRAYYERLMGAGIRIFEWCNGILHSKTAVVDGVWGTIGSFNLERTSLRLNHEMNVAFADPALAAELEQSFHEDRALCTPLSLDQWRKRPLWHKALEKFLFLFRKMV